MSLMSLLSCTSLLVADVRDLSQEVVLVTIDLAKVLTWKGDVARAAELA